MQDKPVALITGANKGIGLQIAREMVRGGFTVLIGSRDPAKGEAAAKSIGSDAHAVRIDVTDRASISAAARHIHDDFGRLDVLFNNAGISHAGKPGKPFDDILNSTRMTVVDIDELRAIFETNVFSIVSVTQAMLPLLREAPAGRVVNISSGAGSLTIQSNPDNPNRHKFGAYSASKTAVNAVTLAFSIELESTNIKVNAACPGFTKTDLNNFEGTQSVEDAVKRAVSLALIGPDGQTGSFSGNNGDLPW